jgi:hypothetical protein
MFCIKKKKKKKKKKKRVVTHKDASNPVVGVHVPNYQKTDISGCTIYNPRFGDHDQRDILLHFKELTVSTLEYKYRPTFRYLLTNSIIIETLLLLY